MNGTNDLAAGNVFATDGGRESRAPRASRANAALTRRDFFDVVVAAVRESVSEEHAKFRYSANPTLLKIDFGNHRVHYEVWPDTARNHVEIGLHFEDGPVSAAAYLAYFDARIVEIKHLLGVAIELERWTVTWGHLYETVALVRLDRAFARVVADRLAAQIDLLQPMVDAAAVPIERQASPARKRDRWPRRGAA